MIYRLFDIPVWQDLVDPNTYNKDQILETIEKNYDINPNRDKWGSQITPCRMHHSYMDDNNNQYHDINYNILKVVYENKINKFIGEVLGDIEGFTCNMNIVNYTAMKTGGFMSKHHHIDGQTEFVGVHYLRFDKITSSGIRFWNPHSTFSWQSIYHSIFNNIGVCQVGNLIPIEEDSIIIYPSFLEHDIPEQMETDNLRISIAFNFSFSEDKSND